jgi:xanthine dehydrogenase YagS FAD-binding subunit
MRPFTYSRNNDVAAAAKAGMAADQAFLAGGTTLLDLAKLDVLRPAGLIDINGLAPTYGSIESRPDGLRLGAMVRMADAAANPDVAANYPVIAQSLLLAASAQIRNMASLGGNVLQRTRCTYYRDTRWAACNKRNPGSGCAAMEGVTRKHAVLGTSDSCIAAYPGDFAQALVALDAMVEVMGPEGARSVRFENLHRLPGDTPHLETNLQPGDLITAFNVPAGGWTRRSLYLKIRDRDSYEFALASAAVALELDSGRVKQARIALGGVATKPWRAREAEAELTGHDINSDTAAKAAQTAFAGAKTHGANAYKVELGRQTLQRALLEVASMEVKP